MLLGRRRQILIPVLRDVNVVFDPHPSNRPVSLQDFFVDILAVFGIVEEGVDDKFAEVDLNHHP